MVKTSRNILDTNPVERMEHLKEISSEKKDSIAAKRKELEELEQKKKAEIEELEHKKRKNIEELQQKKKELEEMEQKKVKEIEETEDLIEKSFQDLMRHKRKIMQDEEELQKTKSSLLEDVAGTAQKTTAQNQGYGSIIEQLQQPRDIYEAANRGFYSNLTELRNRAANGQITSEEERFVEQLRERFESFEEQTTAAKDRNDYIKRSLNILDQIENYSIKK